MFIYTVIFYTVEKKENEIKIHSSYKSLQDAINFVNSFPTYTDNEVDMCFNFSGDVIETRQCGIKETSDSDDMEEEYNYPFHKVSIVQNELRSYVNLSG